MKSESTRKGFDKGWLGRKAAHLSVYAGVTLVGLAFAATAAAQGSGSPGLVLEEMQSGFVVTPVVKLTDVDDDLATIAGLYGGYLTDGHLLIGAGAYWLTGGAGEVDMAYGGGVVEWFSNPGGRVSASIGSLVGVGSATLDTVVGRSAHGRFGFFGRRGTLPTIAVRYRQEFFVAEPQASFVLNANDWLRVGLGAGYRLVGGASGFEERLRGFTASVGLQLGPS